MRWLFVIACFFNLFFAEAVLAVSEEEVNTQLQEHIKPQAAGNRIGKIIIEDRGSGISQSTWVYVKHALDYYKKDPPLFIILELNTPGGEVFTSQKISEALKEMDTQYNVPIVAFINNWAISAGAMLAYSSRFIAVVKDASMGAAEPILQDTTTGETKTASEKVNSAFRADFANRAHFFDRNPLLAEAMVDKDIILVIREGKIIKLDTENQIKDTDRLISPKGKLLTLNTEQLLEYGVADIYLPPARLPIITTEESNSGKWPANKELLFEAPFFKSIPNAVVDEYQMDWKIRLLSLLTNPIVTSALFMAMMIGFYIEINTPGFGVAGTIALSALMLLLLSSVALEVVDWLEIILLFAGLSIILVDLLILPTFGLLGIIGLILFLGGLFGLLLPNVGSIDFELDTHTFNAAGEAFFERLSWLLGSFLLGLFFIGLLARFVMPKLNLFKRFVLQGHEQEGYWAGTSPNELPAKGVKGIAMTTLRPSGKVEIEGIQYDAMSTGRLIDRGTSVIVIGSDGNNLIVEEKLT